MLLLVHGVLTVPGTYAPPCNKIPRLLHDSSTLQQTFQPRECFLDPLRLCEHRRKQVTHAREPLRRVRNVELRGVEGRFDFVPGERRRHRGPLIGPRHVRRGYGFAGGDLQVIELDLVLFTRGY
jgi:hypothetical protein